mgnify:FL=1
MQEGGEGFYYEVTSFVNNKTVQVELPIGAERDFYMVMNSSNVASPALKLYNCYETFETLTGLTHLNGKEVSIRVDGKTEASPLNTQRNYNSYTVSGGSVTLPERGAIISVGLPIVTDIQTLDSQSIETESAKTESTIVNKLYVSYYNSRGLYVNHEYPDDDTITDMEDHEAFFEPDAGIESYKPHELYSRREEIVIKGDWSAASSTAFRNVDPQPIGVRGFLLDEEKIGE